MNRDIDEIIKKHDGWKGQLLTELRTIIHEADPELTEEVKWRMKTRPEGLPVWSHNGILCFAEIWKDNVKLLFPKGAQLEDANNLFNARLNSKDIRAIEFHEGDTINHASLKDLVQEAVAANRQS